MDEIFMKRALELSKNGASLTHPNPMVGAVIVKDGEVIGEGWHHGPGLPHAEVEALKSCKTDPKGATLYVTLEPCNHWGKTPPCTEAVINAGIAEVKMAVPDTNRRVKGGGKARLVEAGIKVEEGLGRDEALEINRSFFYHSLTGRPWVIMKAASSLDGKISAASGESQWITGALARQFVHQLRSEVGAVLVGSGTLLKDNPSLTNRSHPPIGRQPLKVLLDSALQVSTDFNLVSQNPSNLLIFCTERAAEVKVKQLQDLGAQVVRQSEKEKVNLHDVLDFLGGKGILSLLVEGGGEVFASFINEDLVNEFYLFYAPFFIGGAAAKGVVGGEGIAGLKDARRLKIETVTHMGEDLLVHAYKEDLKNCLRV